jgi:tetratricopeptide (TPR) repeat protein
MESVGNLVDRAWQLRRERGNPADAERLLMEALAAARQSGSRREMIRTLKALVHVVRDQGQDERALPICEEAVVLSRQEGDPILLAHTVRHLGDLHRDAKRFTDAERCYEEALALYRAASDPPSLDFANALRPAALLKEAQGDVAGAKQLWTEARQRYREYPEAIEECSRHLSRLEGLRA